jgi:hypothetical protein
MFLPVNSVVFTVQCSHSFRSRVTSRYLRLEHVTLGRQSLLIVVPEDLLCAPASKAFVERILSLYGLLSAGRRDRMHKSLKMRAILKLNAYLL